MSNKVLEYLIEAKDKTQSGITSAMGKIKGLATGIFSNLMNIKAGWDMLSGTTMAAVNTMVGAAKHLWSAITEAMKFETVTKQFAILMGSMDKAKKHMEDLADFAAETPFEFNEIAQASRILMTFSDGALGAKDSLTLLGDAASATGNKFEEVGFWTGRLYASLKGGQPIGMAAARLTEMAILTPEVRQKMEDLTATAGHSAEAWAVLKTHMEKYKGGMEELAKTGDGLVSTVQDNWTAIIRDFGQTFLGLAKTELTYLITTLDRLRSDGSIKKWAEEALAVVKPLAEGVMNLFDGESRKITIDAAWDTLLATFTLGAGLLEEALLFGIEKFASSIPTVLGAAWSGIKGVGKAAVDIGRNLGAGAINVGIGIGGEIGKATGLQDAATSDKEVAEAQKAVREAYGFKDGEKTGSLADRTKPLLDAYSETLKKNAAEVSQAAEDRRARGEAANEKYLREQKAEKDLAALYAKKDEDDKKKTDESELAEADRKARQKEQAESDEKTAKANAKAAEEQEKAAKEAEKNGATGNLQEANRAIQENAALASAKFGMDDVDARMARDKQGKEDARMQAKYEQKLDVIQKRIDDGGDPNKLNRKDKAIWDLAQERKDAQNKVAQAEQDRKNAQAVLMQLENDQLTAQKQIVKNTTGMGAGG